MTFPLNAAGQGIELRLAELLATGFSQFIQKHKAHVVTRELILGAWIAQANKQMHIELEAHQRSKSEVARRSQLDAFREGQVANVCRLVNLKVSNAHGQCLRQLVSWTFHQE